MSEDKKLSTAYDIRYSHSKKCYYLIKVKYNRESILEKTVIGDSRILAVVGAKKAIVDRVLSINIDLKAEEEK